MGVPLFKLDLRDKLLSTGGVTNMLLRQTQIVAALDAELERLFDARIGAGTSSDKPSQLQTRKGEEKLPKGAGDGSMFGTDEANSGGLLARETMRNNLTAEWNGDNLVVTNTGGANLTFMVSLPHLTLKSCLTLLMTRRPTV